jgi:ferric-dicitrate binding protein FerR (iron transport regulator)
MIKQFQTVEDVVADESFLSWYYRESEERIHEWESWLSENPDQQPLVQEAIDFMDQVSLKEMPVSVAETEQKLAALHERINENAAPVVRMRSSRKRWWIAAAAAVLLIAASVTYFTWSTSCCSSIDTTYGEVRSNALPDGSTMILNANSNATLSKDWEEGNDREVWLNGEAFFKVAKTPQKSRFIVHAGEMDVIVTGTQFNVMNRDGKTTVLLTEGSVILRTKDGKEMAMKPGDFVEIDRQLVERKLVKEENVLAWKENRLAFDNTSLKEAAQMISYHYGVKITLEDNVSNAPLTGIMANNNLDDLLKAIEAVADVKVTRTNTGEIIFSAK